MVMFQRLLCLPQLRFRVQQNEPVLEVSDDRHPNEVLLHDFAYRVFLDDDSNYLEQLRAFIQGRDKRRSGS